VDKVAVREKLQELWKRRNSRWILILLGIGFLFLLALVVGAVVPEQIDWVRTYRPATRELIALRSPYSVQSFYNPPWILIPMIPMALLPDSLGNGVLFVVSFCVIIYSAIRMGAKPVSLLAFMLSFPVIFLLLFGQIDWLVLLGFTLPPPIGLIFILSKPQIGIPYAVFIFVESWRSGGVKQVICNFSPLTIMLMVSFVLFGYWVRPLEPHILTAIYNLSLWPTGIVIGLVFLVKAIHKRNKGLSIVAGPFLSPYVGVHSWTVSILAILSQKWETIAVAIGSWIVCLVLILR